MQITEINKIFISRLKNIYSVNEINSIFGILAEHYLHLSKIDILLKKHETLNEENRSKFFVALDELKKHKPVQYVVGETCFYGLKIKVNENVLIPRPETEELVNWIITDSEDNSRDNEGAKILDIGTGSGCIAITLKKNLPKCNVFAMDISEKALKVASENALLNNVNINFLKFDILNSQFTIHNSQFTIIVSNPPYVTVSDKDKMQRNVLEYEPHLALFAPPQNPLLYYEFIINFAKMHLNNNGSIYFEINEAMGKQVKHLLISAGFTDVIIKKDLSGKDRMIRAK